MRRRADDIGDPTVEIAEADRILSLVNQNLERHRPEAGGLRVRLTQVEANKQQLNAIQTQMEGLEQDLEHLGSEEKAIAARIEQFQLIATQEGRSGRVSPDCAGQGRPGPDGTSPQTLR